MRNIFKIVAAFAVAALAFASCKSNELVPEAPKGPTHTVKFTVDASTKTNMEINGTTVSYSWTADDLGRISVYENGVMGIVDDDNSVISAGNLVILAVFDGSVTEEEREYTAVLNGVVENQTPRVADGLYDETADVLVAKPVRVSAASAVNDGLEFQFRRVVAVNKMTLVDLPAGETLETVTISSDKAIAGAIEGSEWAEELFDNTLKLTVNAEIPANGQLTLYYMAVPVDEAILTVDAKVGEDSYKKKFGKGLTTKAGDVTGYSVGMKKQAHIVLTENFNSNHTTSTTYGGTGLTSEIAADWNYTWSFSSSNIYASMNTVRFGTGTSTALGYIQSANILSAIPAGAEFKVLLYAAKWDTNTTIKLTYNGEDSTQAPANEKMTSPSGSTYNSEHFTKANTFTLTKVADVNILKIGNVQDRFILDKLEVSYDGDAPSAIKASDVSDVAAAGVVDATFNFSVVNIIGTPAVTPDGTIVTAASVEGNTVTYTVAENTTFAAREGTIIITVGDESKTVTVSQLGKVPEYEGDGTLESPYTVADALLKIQTLDPGASSEEVYVTGLIKSVGSYNSTYGSISYKIGAEETVLDIYGGLDFDGAKFAGLTDLTVGQNVVVRGNLKDFNGTKEMDANNKLVSVNGFTYVLKSIAITGQKILFDEGDPFSKGEAVVTASYRGSKEATNVTASAEFTGYESTVGSHKITVTYTENGFTEETSYQVTVADATEYDITTDYDDAKGSVLFTVDGESGKTASKAGKAIVVTVEPGAKYIVETFTVNDEAQTLTDGKYAFTMPNRAVAIAVTFADKPKDKVFSKFTSALEEGDYVITHAGSVAMSNEISGDRLTYNSEITVTNDAITNPSADLVWHIAKSGDYWTLYNDDVEKYAASTGARNKAQLLDAGTDDMALWTITLSDGKYNVVNKKNTSSSVNANLRYNDGYGFACYAAATGEVLTLYKLDENLDPRNLAFSARSDAKDIKNGTSVQALELNGITTGGVRYTSSRTDVATINETTGAITLVSAGETTITASAAKYENYAAESDWYTLIVSDTRDACANPTANPGAGEVDKDTKVTLECATPGAKIYYRVGSTGDFSLYSSQINIDAAKTIYAYAEAEGYKRSATEEFAYTLTSGSGPTTVSLSMADYVSQAEITVSSGSSIGTKVSTIALDGNISVSVVGNGNTGTFWSNASGTDWRIYSNANTQGKVTITAGNSKKIKSVKFTFGTSNGGGLKYGSSSLTSGTEKTISPAASSVELTVPYNSGKTGQAQIRAIAVEYE